MYIDMHTKNRTVLCAPRKSNILPRVLQHSETGLLVVESTNWMKEIVEKSVQYKQFYRDIRTKRLAHTNNEYGICVRNVGVRQQYNTQCVHAQRPRWQAKLRLNFLLLLLLLNVICTVYSVHTSSVILFQLFFRH